jgi:flavin-dependent dehydrogenase
VSPFEEPTVHPTYDVVIVGARVAGAATALLLARAGLDVLVVDQAREGSDTLSTHALMRGGVIQLSRWGLLDELRAAGTPPVRRTVVRYGEREEVVDIRPLPHCPALYAPRRTTLDPLLATAARDAGADVRFGVRVTGLLRDDEGRVTGVTATDRDGRHHEVHARLTVGADGVRSRVAQAVEAPVLVRGRHASAFIGGYVEGLDVDGYQWLYGEGVAGGIIPTDHGRASVWIGTASTEFDRLRRQPDRGFGEIFPRLAPDWWERLRTARWVEPKRGFAGIPGFQRQAWGPGWALVGDAGYFKDPLSTHGMTDAMRDAELLADAIRDAFADPTGDAEREALAGYQTARDTLSADLFARVETVAAYDWTLAELRGHLLALSRAMRPEVDHLLARDLASTASPASTST